MSVKNLCETLIQYIKLNYADTPDRKKAITNINNAKAWLKKSDFIGGVELEVPELELNPKPLFEVLGADVESDKQELLDLGFDDAGYLIDTETGYEHIKLTEESS